MPGNLVGIHSGVWGGDWSSSGAADAVARSAAAGFDLIEISAPALDPDPTNASASETARLLGEHRIAGVVSLALGADEDINTEDVGRSDRGERRLAATVAYAADLGADFIGGVLFSKMARYDHPPTARARANSIAVLRRTAELAAREGITLGIEYVNRYESNLLNTAAQTIAFIEDLGADNVVLHLDTFHAHVEEPDQRNAVLVAGPRLGYVHASESHRGELGTGSIDWTGLFRELARTGYAGPITVETFSNAVVSAAQAVDIGLWRTLWSDPVALASRSHAFIRSHLAAAEAGLQPAPR